MAAIQRINKLKGNTIRLGEHLLIPMASADVSDYELTAPNRIARAQQHATGNKLTYTVQQGDTLWDISREHKVSVEQLAKWNGIAQRAALRPGQKLVIVQDAGSDSKMAGISRTVTYKVRRGDSLARIAQRFSVSVSDIVKWNQIDTSNYLQPGQQLKLIVGITQV